METSKDGRPAIKWGRWGRPYAYDPSNPRSKATAKGLATRQRKAIKARQRRR